MKPKNGNLIRWMAKAESDYRAAMRLLRYEKEPTWDAVCFHAQQCAEKYLKAFLIRHRVTFPKTHDLLELLSLCSRVNADLESLRKELHLLNLYSVDVRYPGLAATKREAKQCLIHLQKIHKIFQELLKN